MPVCASFTHVDFSTYRLEPQYAIFGHSAGAAAALAVAIGSSDGTDVNTSGIPMVVAMVVVVARYM